MPSTETVNPSDPLQKATMRQARSLKPTFSRGGLESQSWHCVSSASNVSHIPRPHSPLQVSDRLEAADAAITQLVLRIHDVTRASGPQQSPLGAAQKTPRGGFCPLPGSVGSVEALHAAHASLFCSPMLKVPKGSKHCCQRPNGAQQLPGSRLPPAPA
ncbi:uncharacterized protein EI97DRAFT_442964 [Westerdykella ornata]|uniref:Uncharacterized protein n=1 Tax=Westerdykella ornata TaxID=318751 RepID=A0A6A6JM54_WESOR|nr:uncharacterized protein EI97DRAFT_442964 [Westerdykella ornata]KAF2275999.1 hypothetical protein EI97DRAFT_442964 [Westerdykella ornata]